MRKLALFSLVAATAAVTFSDPKPKFSFIFSLKGHRMTELAATRDGRRLYYVQDTSDLFMYDRSTRKTTRLLGDMIGPRSDIALSAAGDRLAFCRNGEEGDGPHLWIVSLDPKTGLLNGAPHRVSSLKATDPSFSPDGRSIAFGARTSAAGTENLVVVPANGGPERVLAELPGDIWPVRWAGPDSIYFGLSFDDEKDAAKNGTYRIGLSGGAPRLVLHSADGGANPGMSPDRRFIVDWDPTWDSVRVSTTSGKRVTAYTPAGDPGPDVWYSSGRAIGTKTSVLRVIHVVDLADGRDRALTDSATFSSNPEWLPDGKQFAVAEPTNSAIAIVNVADGHRRTIRVPSPPSPIGSMEISPDGRLLYYREQRSEGAIRIVDISSGAVRQIVPKSAGALQPRWRSDSRAILYATTSAPAEQKAPARHEIHEIGIAAGAEDRVLYTFSANCNGWCGRMTSDSMLVTWANNEYQATNIRAHGSPRTVYKREGSMIQPVASFSHDGRWIAVRQFATEASNTSIELVRVDGSEHRTVPLSFKTAPAASNPWILGDGSELIVAECEGPRLVLCRTGMTFHRIDVKTGRNTVIMHTAPVVRSQYYDFQLSPNGRSLTYMMDLDPIMSVYDLDFTELLKPAR